MSLSTLLINRGSERHGNTYTCSEWCWYRFYLHGNIAGDIEVAQVGGRYRIEELHRKSETGVYHAHIQNAVLIGLKLLQLIGSINAYEFVGRRGMAGRRTNSPYVCFA